MAAANGGSSDEVLHLAYWERAPPHAILAAAALTGATLAAAHDPKYTKASQPTLRIVKEREELEGLPNILRYIVRAHTSKEDLKGGTPLETVQVDQFLDFASQLVAGAGLEAACTAMNDYLAVRTFLAGYSLTAADVACWGQLEGTPVWDKMSRSNAYPHLSRWFSFVASIPEIAAVAEQYTSKRRNAPSKGAAAAAAGSTAKAAAGSTGSGAAVSAKAQGETGSFDIDLPGAAEGKVVTRFPPEPSGYLHIGHAKAALLNQHIAQLYKGRLLLRFDDTNPSKEKDEFVENILQDLQALGFKHDAFSHTSDHFLPMLECAKKLIAAGVLYADDTPVEQMREERMNGIESKRRNRPVAETQAVFEEMLKGNEEGLKNCLRFKMDMQAPNKALRDPVAYRCNLTPHWKTKKEFKAYPTYDFACPFVDAKEGVTHALRTTEYKDREAQYYWILERQRKVCPELPHVHLWDFSRLTFVNSVMSKRKLQWFVDQGRVDGWDDARFPTVQGVLRRGMQLEALKEFILSQGASRNVTLQEWDKIWTINKRVIDPVCPRHTAVKQSIRATPARQAQPSKQQLHAVASKAATTDSWRWDYETMQQLRSNEKQLPLAEGNDLWRHTEIFIMLPLGIISVGKMRDGEEASFIHAPSHNAKALDAQFAVLKRAGAAGVMMDVWWGICENIPLPPWVLAAGEEKDDEIFYTDKRGGRDHECLSLGCNHAVVLGGRSPLQAYADFAAEFARQCKEHGLWGNVVKEICVGTGPCGELRYPAYQEKGQKWSYMGEKMGVEGQIQVQRGLPGIGEFQCYDKIMLADLKAAAEKVHEPEW
ncbi:hypothetical protein WJX73_001913 [Symbiochloris irregularis]|uniref:Beta-amylase n=1 Tax=Symbiochloris irregularis TaxID=706552 RepID=A0AAW1NV95_9CHLO